jgi:GTP-binding protein
VIPDLESRSPRTPDHGYRIPAVKVISTEFVTSAASGGRADDIPADGLAQFAFAGRSNVGKSTLLNALTRAKLARTSAAPGKTRLANIYRVTVEGGPGGPGQWRVYFVDLPGYGYARGGSDAAAELAKVAAGYYGSGSGVRDPGSDLNAGVTPRSDRGPRIPDHGSERAPRATLHLIDARHPALPSDIDAARWFDALGIARHVVATKIDKLNRSERNRNLKEVERIFERTPLPVSAASGEGLDELWRLIARVAREQRP